MSLEAVAWALRQPVSDPIAKLLLISLADHHNASTEVCFPSRARLAEAGCCSPATTKRKLAWLRDEGWIEIQPRYTESGRQTSNAYLLKMEGRSVTPSPQPGAQPEPDGEAHCEPPRGSGCPPPRGSEL